MTPQPQPGAYPPAAYTPRPPKSKALPWVIVGLLLIGAIGFFGLLCIAAVSSSATGSQVGLIELSGAISDQGAGGLFGGTSGARQFIRDCEKAGKDDSVKAVIIRINSPGGSSAASQEMYQAVRRLRVKKPVVASMGDVAASGGYYVAAACNKIYANPSTLTGSIGVISQFMNYQALFRKVGLDETTIKSGKFKDAGSPTRPLTPEEKQYFQQLVNDVYQQFLTDVLDGRKEATGGKLTRANLVKVADGRVITGMRAKQALLVDETGGLHEATIAAGKLGKINFKDLPEVKRFRSGGGLGALLGAESSSAVGQVSDGIGQGIARGMLQELKAEAQTTPEIR